MVEIPKGNGVLKEGVPLWQLRVAGGLLNKERGKE